jgi:hypothetical protein
VAVRRPRPDQRRRTSSPRLKERLRDLFSFDLADGLASDDCPVCAGLPQFVGV